jgi:hypothetical protein
MRRYLLAALAALALGGNANAAQWRSPLHDLNDEMRNQSDCEDALGWGNDYCFDQWQRERDTDKRLKDLEDDQQ